MKGKIFRTFFLTMLMVMAFGMTVCAAPAKQQAVQGVTPEGVVSIFQSTSGKTVTIRGYNGFCRTYTVPDYTVLPEMPEKKTYNDENGWMQYYSYPSLSYSANVEDEMSIYRDLAVASLQEYLYAGLNDDYSGMAFMWGGGYMEKTASEDLTNQYKENFLSSDRENYHIVFGSRGETPLGAKIVAVSTEDGNDGDVEVIAYCVDSSGQQFTIAGGIELVLYEPMKAEQVLYAADSQYHAVYDVLEQAHQSGIINKYGILNEFPEPYFSYMRWKNKKDYECVKQWKQQWVNGELNVADFGFSYTPSYMDIGWYSNELN